MFQAKGALSTFQKISSRKVFAGSNFTIVSITHFSIIKIGLN